MEDRAEAHRLDSFGRQVEELRDADGERGQPLASIAFARALASVGASNRSRRSSRLRAARSSASATADWRSEWAKGFVTRPAAPRVSAWLNVS
jgi:hypothetical protein